VFLSLMFSILMGADLVRVDIPDHPDAIATSRLGSTLLVPPSDGTPWREAPVPETTEIEHDGWTATEAIDAMKVGPWHDAGVDGSGVKIAIFDIQWFGLELNPSLADLPSHDCFGHRSCRLPINTIDPQFAFETGGHGVACAEVIHAIAPGAELHLVRVNGLTALENAVDWAVREGVDLVSMSMSFFNESFYDGTGAINNAMDELTAGGVLMVSSAGNYARQHYSARFTDNDRDNRHDFDDGREYLPVYLDKGTTKVSLIWDNYNRCGSTDLDAYIYDQDARLVGRSTRSQVSDDDQCFPAETVTARVSETGWHYLLIHRASGRSDVDFNVLTRGGSIYGAQAQGSVTDPGSHPEVFTVGAVDADGYRFNDVEGFSSQGPTPAGVPKPDIAGPDGLTTSVYGPGRFYGTSAATPSVAAALALIMSEDPSRTARDAAVLMKGTALHDRTTWAARDPTEGFGKARLHALNEPPPGCGDGSLLWLTVLWLPFGVFRRTN
jgi:hypothetical protein